MGKGTLSGKTTESKVLLKSALQIFTLFTGDPFDRFFIASPIFDSSVKAGIVGHDHKTAAFIFADQISQFRNKLEVQRIGSLIAFDKGNRPVRFLKPDQALVTHVRTVPGIEYDQLRFISGQLKQRDPEIPDILTVN